MDDEKNIKDKNLEKELMEKIQMQYARGDYNAALALIDDYIAIIGIDKQIYLLREKIQEKKKASQSTSAVSGKPSELKVVSAFDELAQSSDSVEFKSADVESSIASTLKKKEMERSPAREEKIPQEEQSTELKITDEDIMELSEDMSVPPQKEPEKMPSPAEEEKQKHDTKPFDFKGYLKDHSPKEDLQLHIPFEEDGTQTGTQLDATEKNRQEEISNLPKKETEPAPEQPKPKVEAKLEAPTQPPPPPPAQPEAQDKIPPADKEFVQLLEAELSKSRKKPTFTPSFLKTDPKKEIPPSPHPPSARATPEQDLFTMDDEPEPPVRKPLIDTGKGGNNRKLFLRIGSGVLGAAALFSVIFFSGIFRAKKSEPQPVVQETPIRPRKTRPKPQQPVTQTGSAQQQKTDTTEKPAAPTPDQEYSKYLDQAEALFNQGKYNEALQMAAMAKKIKSDLRLRIIEGKIDEKIMEIQSQAPEIAAKAQKEKEENDFNTAHQKDTREAYQEYLKAHPTGPHQGEVFKRMKELEKEEQKNFEFQLVEKVKAARQVTLRSDPAYLSLANIQENWSKIKPTGANCEQITVNGSPVAIDYTTGLMWYRIETPIDYQKALFWAARRFANYSGWRMPTTDETKTLMTVISKLFPGSQELEIWTCDHVSKYQQTIWTVKYPSGTLSQVEENQYKYLFIVRTIK